MSLSLGIKVAIISVCIAFILKLQHKRGWPEIAPATLALFLVSLVFIHGYVITQNSYMLFTEGHGRWPFLLFLPVLQFVGLLILVRLEIFVIRWMIELKVPKAFPLFHLVNLVYFGPVIIGTLGQIGISAIGPYVVGTSAVNLEYSFAYEDLTKSLSLQDLETEASLPSQAKEVNHGEWTQDLRQKGWTVRKLNSEVEILYDSERANKNDFVTFKLRKAESLPVTLRAKVVDGIGNSWINSVWPFSEKYAALFSGDYLLIVNLDSMELCSAKVIINPRVQTILYADDKKLYLSQEAPENAVGIGYTFDGYKIFDLKKYCD